MGLGINRFLLDEIVRTDSTNTGLMINVKNSPYNAKGDGVTDDGPAIQAAINAAALLGGGIVFVPTGTYNCIASGLNMAANVTLRGAGRWATRINNVKATNAYALYCQNIAGWAVEDIALQSTTTVDFNVPLEIEGCTDASISRVRLIGGTHAGCEIALSSRRIQVRDLRITGVAHNSGLTGGTGFWLFRDVTDCQISNLSVDTVDGNGLVIDAGTSDGLGVVTQHNTFSNVRLYNVCQGPSGMANYAVQIEGSKYNTITGLVIDTVGTGTTTGNGIQFARDQAGINSDYNTITGFALNNLTGIGILISGGHYNIISDGTISKFNTNNGSSQEAFGLTDTPAGQVHTADAGTDTTDNMFSDIEIDNSAGGTYGQAVVLSSTTFGIKRNRFQHIGWGTPVHLMYTGNTETVVPLYGADRNIIEGVSGVLLGSGVDNGSNNTTGIIYTVNTLPPSTLGNNGDFAFRTDTPGTVNQRLYVKSAAAWVGLL